MEKNWGDTPSATLILHIDICMIFSTSLHRFCLVPCSKCDIPNKHVGLDERSTYMIKREITPGFMKFCLFLIPPPPPPTFQNKLWPEYMPHLKQARK